MIKTKSKLKVFLYILIRDLINYEDLEKIINELNVEEYILSSEKIFQLVNDLEKKLLD